MIRISEQMHTSTQASSLCLFSICCQARQLQIKSLKIPYSSSYIQTKSNFDFLWINSFYEKNYTETLSKQWIILNDSDEIKDEFIANATCVDSNLYKAYKLI